MIFLSAQPARIYFKWQLQVQLFNFNRLGIKQDEIHVLFGYDSKSGIDERLLNFANNCNFANFFFYEDTRPFSNYEPTIRPHIIKKHLNKFPYLQSEAIFYHDCDIIFRELPDFPKLLEGDEWYLSDTSGYIGADIIKGSGSELLTEMCSIVGLDKKVLLSYNYAGGAQYLMKNVNYKFWDKVEHDSNSLFDYLFLDKERLQKRLAQERETEHTNDYPQWVQAWCADMWAVFWNGILYGYDIKIDEELNFSWAISEINRWDECKIFHNAGVSPKDSEDLFYKKDFLTYTPFKADLEYVNKNKCSYKYVEEIRKFVSYSRETMDDITFAFVVNSNVLANLSKFDVAVKYLNKHLNTGILIIEYGEHSAYNQELLPDKNIRYIFCNSDSPSVDWSIVNSILNENIDTPFFCLYDGLSVVDVNEIIEGVKLLRNAEYDIITPYGGQIINITDGRPFDQFQKKLDILCFENHPSPPNASLKSFDGCVIAKKELLTRWGNDKHSLQCSLCSLEGISNIITSGGKYRRTAGTLYLITASEEV